MKRVIIITIILIAILASNSFGFIASDPSSRIPSARAIALGNSFVALTDDSTSVYTNPAGLASIKKLQLSSMFGKFVDEYNYSSLTVANPTKYGVFGVGYTGSAIAGAPVTRIRSGTENTADPIYEVDPSAGTMSNGNNVLVLSYGKKLSNINVGTSLRFFSANLSGGGISNGDAFGYDMDLGVQTWAKDWLSVAMVGKHILPSSLGGRLVYTDGHQESYPATLTTGALIKVLGDEKALRSFKGQKLVLITDLKSNITQRLPSTAHLGLEWAPVSAIALRLGIDQSPVGGVVENNLTAGVGLNVRGFQFDYAYHQYVSAPGMNNNYFSISYKLPVKKKKLVEPANKLDLIRFKDVPKSHFAYNQISYLATQGLIKGYPDKTFKPSGKITRAELSTLLVRSSGADLKIGKHIFKDVSPKHWAYDYIYTAAQQNIVNGYPHLLFKPQKRISRAEGITMVSRYAGVLPEKYASQFNDVDKEYWAARYISGAKKAGLLQYLKTTELNPKKELTRAEVVEVLYRTSKVQGILAKGILKGRPDLLSETKLALNN